MRRVAFVAAWLAWMGASAQNLRWMYVEGGTTWNDEVCAIARAPDSSVLVAGFSSLGSDHAKFAVMRLSGGGQRRWLDTLGGSITELDRATSVAVGADGSAYATGRLVDYDDTTWVAVVRVDTMGVRRWATRFGDAYWHYVTGCQIVCGPDGNLYLAARVGDKEKWALDFGVASVSPNGSVRWCYRWPGPDRTDELAYAIALGTGGHLYAVGSVMGQQEEFAVIGLDTSGAERWTFILTSPGNDCARCVAVGADGSVYPAGVFGHTTPDLVVFGLSDSGTRRWSYSYDGPAHGDDEASAIVCGPDGNIYVAGTSEDSNYRTDMVVVSLDASGHQRWVYRYDTTAAAEEHASALAVSTDGYVYVAGYAVRWYMDSCDFAVVCLDTAGREQWVYRYGTGIGYARACAIALGADRGVYAAGWIDNPFLHDMMVVSLEPASGVAELTETTRGPLCATIVRRTLSLQASSELLDVSGRKMLDVRPGVNDVSHLAPGVYFVREAQAQAQAQAVRKVIVTR